MAPCSVTPHIHIPVQLSEEIIVVNMESEPTFKKMDTVVKLDSVSLIFYRLCLKEVSHYFLTSCTPVLCLVL